MSTVNDTKMSLYIKTVLVASLLIVIFMPNTILASSSLGTAYHVYVEEEYVGKVDDKKVIYDVIDEIVSEKRKEFADLDLTISESISSVSEKMFNPTYENQAVKTYLKEHLTVKAEAVELKVDDQIIGHFQSEAAAKDVIKSYKLKYVSKEDLNFVEENANLESTTDDLLLKEEPSQDISVDDVLVESVELLQSSAESKQLTEPENVLTVDQGVKLLEKGTLEDKKHNVKKGEYLEVIANQYDLTMDSLLDLNDKLTEDSILQIDQKINVTEFESIADVIVTQKERKVEKIAYETEVIESDQMNKGEEKIKQKGKNGKKEVLYEVEKTNNKETKKKSLEESTIKQPVDEVVVKGTYVVPSKGTGDLSWPAKGGHVSSHFGKRWGSMHKGTDIAGPTNRTITAADHGVVESAGWHGGYGNKVVINHNNGMKTVYAHLSSISVKSGQKIEKGTQLGIMGSTGNSTGIHLHFEVHKNGGLENPMNYF